MNRMDSRTAIRDGGRGIVIVGEEKKEMDMRCVKSRDKLPDMEGFKEAIAPLIEWVNANCDPHERVEVEMGRAVLISEEMGFIFEVPD